MLTILRVLWGYSQQDHCTAPEKAQVRVFVEKVITRPQSQVKPILIGCYDLIVFAGSAILLPQEF